MHGKRFGSFSRLGYWVGATYESVGAVAYICIQREARKAMVYEGRDTKEAYSGGFMIPSCFVFMSSKLKRDVRFKGTSTKWSRSKLPRRNGNEMIFGGLDSLTGLI